MRIHGGEKLNIKIDLSVSINPLGMPETCREAAAKALCHVTSYPETECERLKEALSAENGGSHIILGNGSTELIYSICHYMSRKFKEYTALIAAPCFTEYEYAIRASGGWVRVVSTEENRDFSITEDICAYVDTDVKLVFVCNPNNPTGQLIGRDLMEKLALRCMAADTLLVIDECFLRFSEYYRSHTMTSCLERYPNVIVIDAFTKFYGMPGLRVGYGVSSDKEILEAIRLQMQPWNINTPAMEAAVAALSDTAFRNESVRFMTRQRNDLIAALKESGYAVVGEPAANFIMFKGREGLRRELNDKGIDIRDCSDMMKYHDTKEFYYRTAVSTNECNNRLIDSLGNVNG